MKTFDIMTTATLRPELLKRTFDSHIENLFGADIKKANLIINIDPVGSDYPERELTTIMDYLDTIPFKSITTNIPDTASFSKAFCWCLGQLSSPFTFNLEEDWELVTKLNFSKMVDLMEQDSAIAQLRLSFFPCDGSNALKNWNKFTNWNGRFYEVPRNLRGTIGWAGHPSLNKSAFLVYFGSILNRNSNPEKQIKGAYPIIMNSRFGTFCPKEISPPAIKDIGRKWMAENGYQKKGTKAFFTEWIKVENNK